MRGRLIFAGLLLALFAITITMTYHLFTSQFPGQNDFLSRWEGARGLFQEGINPYSDTASLSIQRLIYGRAALPTEDLGLFVYPLYTAIMILPTALMPYAWAAATIIVMLLASLVIGLLLTLDVFKWRPKPYLLALLALWAMFNYYGARGVFLGQLGIAVFALEMLAIWALARNMNVVAGVALALATIKPQMAWLLVGFLLLQQLTQRRWRMPVAFFVTWGALMLASFVLVPSWFGEWLAQVQLYPSYTRDGSPVWIITQHYLQLGDVVEGVVNVLFAAWLGWLWWQVLVAKKHERTLWTIAMTLILGNIFSFKTATPHFVAFMLPMVLYFKWLSKHGIGWVLVVLLLTLIVPWGHFATTIEGRLENLVLFLPAPLLMLLVTWVTRKRWWVETAEIL